MKINNILITICARGGSQGVKGKNIRLLNGKPLIAYTIKQALAWGKAKHVVVSTDSKEIAEVSIRYGAKVPFMRPKELSSDTAAKLPAIRYTLVTCEKIFHEQYDTVIDLDATSPIRTTGDIDNAYHEFLIKKPNCLFSVVPAGRNPYFNMVERDKNVNIVVCKKQKAKIVRRQDAPIVYDMNASIYVYNSQYLKDKHTNSVISDKNAIYVMSELSRVDIDREIDFQFIEFLIKQKIVRL